MIVFDITWKTNIKPGLASGQSISLNSKEKLYPITNLDIHIPDKSVSKYIRLYKNNSDIDILFSAVNLANENITSVYFSGVFTYINEK